VSILLSLLLAQPPLLPQIDRRALELQARAEALQARPAQTVAPARPVQAGSANPKPESRRIRSAAAPQRQTVPPQAPPALRRASVGALDLSEITTMCRAASGQADPAAFLSRLVRTRALSPAQASSLSLGCAAYFAGRAEGPASNRGTPGL
jgi:hypothetical protein